MVARTGINVELKGKLFEQPDLTLGYHINLMSTSLAKQAQTAIKFQGTTSFRYQSSLPTGTWARNIRVTAAIGGAVAAMHGADFLCYVTPSEHLAIPDIDDVREGVIVSCIAAHAADIVRLKDHHIDNEVSKARKELNWKKLFQLCGVNDSEKYQDIKNKEGCSMCGEYCALKIIKENNGSK